MDGRGQQRRDLGKALPLGEADDATWLFEHAATTELRRAGSTVTGHLSGLRTAARTEAHSDRHATWGGTMSRRDSVWA
jgi:hypothetical protein